MTTRPSRTNKLDLGDLIVLYKGNDSDYRTISVPDFMDKVKDEISDGVLTWSGRTQEDKNKDMITPLDFKAKGDGITDDTQAFIDLELDYTGRVVDLLGKTYLVDRDFDENNYVNGTFLVNGNHKRKGDSQLLSRNLHLDLAYEIKGLTNNFIQGSCRHGNMLFMTQHYDSAGVDGAQRCLILQYDMSDGTPILIAQTAPLGIGHGQDIGVKYRNGNYTLYAGTAPISAAKITSGICRIQWRGASTSAQDLTFIDLAEKLPNTLGKSYGSLNGGTTEDGEYFIALLYIAGSTQQDLFVVSTDDLDNFSNLASIKPKAAFPVPKLKSASDNNALQGVTGDDNVIALTHGAFRPNSQSCVQLINYQGETLGEYDVNGFKEPYQNNNVNNNVSNTVEYLYYTEQESAHIYNGELYIPFMITFRVGGDVVSRRGRNYLCVGSTSTTDPLGVSTNWVITNMPASKGEWISGSAYTSGSTTRHIKNVYRVSNKRRTNSVNVSTLIGGRSTASLHIQSGSPDISYPSGTDFTLSRYNESSYVMTTILEANTVGVFSLNDTSVASSNDYSTQIQTACLPDTSRYYSKFSFSEAGVPQIQMYGKSDIGSNAGNLVIWAGSKQSYRVIGATGENVFNTNVTVSDASLNVASTTNVGTWLSVSNPLRTVRLQVSTSGWAGLWDSTKNSWIFSSNADGSLNQLYGKTYVNSDFSFKPSSSVTPTSNGELIFEATSNTSVTVKLKGTDGVVRSALLTLA